VVFEPRMMLLDEPLAALDKQLRDAMQLELRRLQQRVGITTVAVTHDQVEALTMADEVAVMCDGRIEQVGSPEDVYARPASEFVARFLGEANLVPVERGELASFGNLGGAASGQAVIRPEQLSLAEPGDDRLRATAVVDEVSFQGARLRVHARLRGAGIGVTLSQLPVAGVPGLAAGDEIEVALDARAVHVIPAAAAAPAVEVARGA